MIDFRFLRAKQGECLGNHDKCGTYEVRKVGNKRVCCDCGMEVVKTSSIKY